jgi:hypothetical protein
MIVKRDDFDDIEDDDIDDENGEEANVIDADSDFAKWAVRSIKEKIQQEKLAVERTIYDFEIENHELKKYIGKGGDVVIPDDLGIWVIGKEVFSNRLDLASVILPKGLMGIDEGAFSGCLNLEKVAIPSSVGSIESHVFWGCDRLTVYCEAEKPLKGWTKDWDAYKEKKGLFDKNRCKVVWGYKK